MGAVSVRFTQVHARVSPGATRLALSSLEDDFSLDAFDEAVANLGAPVADGCSATVAPSSVDLSSAHGLFVPLAAGAGAGRALRRLADVLIEQSMGSCSLWWSEGSERVPACLLVARRLPQPNAWTALVDGQFAEGIGSRSVRRRTPRRVWECPHE